MLLRTTDAFATNFQSHFPTHFHPQMTYSNFTFGGRDYVSINLETNGTMHTEYFPHSRRMVRFTHCTWRSFSLSLDAFLARLATPPP